MNGNRSVLRAIDILKILSENQDGMSLKEIMNQLDLPKTSAYDILKALVSQNMVDEFRDDGLLYRIGLKSFQIGNAYLSNTDLINHAKPHLKTLAESLDKTTFVAVLDKNEVTYLYKHEPPKAILTTSNIGTKNPLHCTSLGKAIMSGLEMDDLTEVLKDITFEKRTDYTLRSTKALLDDLSLSKTRGYAVDNREIEDHTLCIGAPVFNHEGSVIAGISFSGLYKIELDIEKEGNLVKSTASRISRSLGYSGDFYE